jgi:hypothetical protein
LTGEVRNDTVYFLETERIRHHRYGLMLRQTTPLTARLQTVVEGRLRFDAALHPSSEAPQGDLPRPVRDDELDEAEFRDLYADWLGDAARVKVGWQRFDWFDTLTPLNSGLVTPLDLRHGGFGNADDLIVPQLAVAANHPVPLGTGALGSWEWVVARFEPHRLAAGDNGYDATERTEGLAALSASHPVDSGREAELGWRWLSSVGSLELTGMAYHGHERLPHARLAPVVGPTGVPTGAVTGESGYPRVNTYGLFATYADDAWVARTSLVAQPRRDLEVVVAGPEEPGHERLVRLGTGFDYVQSKHLKVYSEQFYTRRDFVDLPEASSSDDQDDHLDDLALSLRLVNESFQDVKITVDGAWYAPRRAGYFGPEVETTLGGVWKVSGGARLVRSFDERSPLETTKEASHLWVAVARPFDVATLFSPTAAASEPAKASKKAKPAKKKKKRKKKKVEADD